MFNNFMSGWSVGLIMGTFVLILKPVEWWVFLPALLISNLFVLMILFVNQDVHEGVKDE